LYLLSDFREVEIRVEKGQDLEVGEGIITHDLAI
jgi:hypothetical protein